MRCDICFQDFLLELYNLSGVDPNKHEHSCRCVYNFGCMVHTYLIRIHKKLRIYLNGEDASRLSIYLSLKSNLMYGNSDSKRISVAHTNQAFCTI